MQTNTQGRQALTTWASEHDLANLQLDKGRGSVDRNNRNGQAMISSEVLQCARRRTWEPAMVRKASGTE